MEVDHQFGSSRRKNIFLGITALVILAFTLRLIQLQIVEGSQYRVRSETQGIKQIPVEPIRGAIYDRYGKVIVADVPSYAVYVTANKFPPASKILLAKILQTDTNTINEKIKQYKTNDFSPVRIWRELDRMQWARLNELHTDLAGVDIVEESKRNYAADIRASHILGYTKEIAPDELKTHGDYYSPGDVIGKAGIESAYEVALRGDKGYELVMVNNRGQRVRSFEDGSHNVRPANGFDLYLGIDAGLQQYAEQLLHGRRGAVVALDPSNGDVLAMASGPDFDPNVFSGITNKAEYDQLANDPNKPLLNRATQAAYPPGSTWKPLMSIAGLTEGLITEHTTVNCPGSYTFGGHTWKCDGVHGTLAVQRAIQASCDVFFYQLAVKMGLDTYHKWGHLFHFGERLGCDVAEGYTNLPSKDYYDQAFGKDKWAKGVLVNLGIGQGEILASPLQLAAYCAAIADNGIWHTPHVVKAVKNKRLNEIDQVPYVTEDLHLRQDVLRIVKAGMFDVVNVPGGTAFSVMQINKLDSIQIAGKTGTAQTSHGNGNHAWFICYAPLDHPKIAMCVLVENAGFGAANSAPIARKLVRYYLTRSKEQEDISTTSKRSDATDALPDVGDTARH